MRGEGEILLLFFRPIVESLVENHFLCPLQFCQRTESVSMKRPCGVVVSMFSFRLINSTPFLPVMKGI